MRIAIALLLSALTPFASATSADDLARRIGNSDGWVSWRVSRAPDAGDACCQTLDGNVVTHRGCDLDGRQWNIGTAPGATGDAAGLVVYAHLRSGVVDKIRAYSATCPVRSSEALRRIEDVDPAASVGWLAAQLRSSSAAKDHDDDEAIAALAFHAVPAAMNALQDLAAAGRPQEQRKTVLFWMGQARGVAGVEVVGRYAQEDTDPDIRQHAVFVMSQAAAHNTYPRILAIARTDHSAEVRGQSLFWLAQMKDKRARADITEALRREQDSEVREQAVFALSQLHGAEADQALIALIRGDFPREVKQKAVFWLGQSGSDTAIAFLDDVLR
ncbi:MAG: HEAT repeat domain-containing protein [Rhodanobacteraceae bacterium]|nr:HEAT repeat domain-containing protein [Rhodanobacteraceae bacterium]